MQLKENERNTAMNIIDKSLDSYTTLATQGDERNIYGTYDSY
jgi:hypothetical protein